MPAYILAKSVTNDLVSAIQAKSSHLKSIQSKSIHHNKMSIVPLVHWSDGQLVHWSFGPLVHGSIGLMFQCSIGPLVHWSIGPLVHSSIGPLVHWFICSLVHWTISPLVHWSIGPLVECQMSLLSEHTSRAPPVIFSNTFWKYPLRHTFLVGYLRSTQQSHVS